MGGTGRAQLGDLGSSAMQQCSWDPQHPLEEPGLPAMKHPSQSTHLTDPPSTDAAGLWVSLCTVVMLCTRSSAGSIHLPLFHPKKAAWPPTLPPHALFHFPHKKLFLMSEALSTRNKNGDRSPEQEGRINIKNSKINGQNGLKVQGKSSVSPGQEKRRVSRAAWSSARVG